MILTIKKDLAEKIGRKSFEALGVPEDRWSWKGHADINLVRLTPKQLSKLATLLDAHKNVRAAVTARKDIELWRSAINNADGVKPRTVTQFCTLLQKFIAGVPGHRVFRRVEDNVLLCYYVNKIEYHPRRESREGGVFPEYTSVECIWEEFGGLHRETMRFEIGDVRSMTVVQALAKQGYVPENAEARAIYLEEKQVFTSIVEKIGEQYLATGVGSDNLDGNPGTDHFHTTKTVQLFRNGEPTRVVVDVFYEQDDTERRDRDHRVSVNEWFWRNAEHQKFSAKEKDDDEDEIDDVDEDVPIIEIPIHPYAAVFDLTKHLRLRVHVSNLTKYEYDAKLADKLIMPAELKSLVTMLIEHKDGGFRDIVKGKAGGAVVLLCGLPGTGKTLTAEVYAEAESRALYSVQCSQLGTDPDALEAELLKVFARARRWRAVLLLDEADVYIHERGGNLEQNAIVGVFLRVLEYQDSVLFMTTNRPDDVDDAIASRCVARLSYVVPTPEEQKKIWRVLADGAGTILPTKTIDEIVAANPRLTGRDVKNLLKLGMLVSRRDKKLITSEIIEFVKRFKPTGDAA